MNTETIIKELKELNTEQMEYVIFRLLSDEVLSFHRLAEIYVNDLELKLIESWQSQKDLAYSLIMCKDPTQIAGAREQLDEKAELALRMLNIFPEKYIKKLFKK